MANQNTQNQPNQPNKNQTPGSRPITREENTSDQQKAGQRTGQKSSEEFKKGSSDTGAGRSAQRETLDKDDKKSFEDDEDSDVNH